MKECFELVVQTKSAEEALPSVLGDLMGIEFARTSTGSFVAETYGGTRFQLVPIQLSEPGWVLTVECDKSHPLFQDQEISFCPHQELPHFIGDVLENDNQRAWHRVMAVRRRWHCWRY